MTRKHFKAIAETFAEAIHRAPPEDHKAIYEVAISMSRTLSQFNPNFSIDRFLDACGVPHDQ